MKVGKKRWLQIFVLLAWLLVMGLLAVQAQDEPPADPGLLRLDDRPRLRVVNASAALAEAQVFVDSAMYFQTLPYGYISNYVPLPPAPGPITRTLQARSAAAPDADFPSAGLAIFEPGLDYTLILADTADGLDAPLVIPDANGLLLAPGTVGVRLVRASSAIMADVEVCVDKRCALLTTAQRASNYITIDAGTLNVSVRLIGADTVLMDGLPVNFKPGEVYSIFVFDPPAASSAPKMVAYIDTLQTPANLVPADSAPPAYPPIEAGLPQPPPPAVPQPGQIPPPAYPPVTGAFLSPTAALVVGAIGLLLLAGLGWLVWQIAAKLGNRQKI
jgi:hypothetical protein